MPDNNDKNLAIKNLNKKFKRIAQRQSRIFPWKKKKDKKRQKYKRPRESIQVVQKNRRMGHARDLSNGDAHD